MELFHRVLGEGNSESLVILHGLFGSSDNWTTLAKRFATDFEVILVDQRNHGKSPHGPDFNYDVMAEDLLELVYNRRLTTFHLLGHSMGGKAAMRFAQRWPEFLASLMVADIGPQAYPPHHDKILEALRTADQVALKSRKSAEAHLARFIEEPGVRQFLLKNLYWKEKTALAWRMNVADIDRQMDRILEALPDEIVEVPTLFMRGLSSNYLRDKDLLTLPERFPDVRVLDFPGAGHWLHAEQPDRLYQLVVDFVGEH